MDDLKRTVATSALAGAEQAIRADLGGDISLEEQQRDAAAPVPRHGQAPARLRRPRPRHRYVVVRVSETI
jgi:hypothetical protein